MIVTELKENEPGPDQDADKKKCKKMSFSNHNWLILNAHLSPTWREKTRITYHVITRGNVESRTWADQPSDGTVTRTMK